MKKIELLAPAGNFDTLKVAINAGCDAVYIGGKHFGARSYAGNFTNEEIVEAIKYAHLYAVKIYVTINTLVYDNEVDDLIKYVSFLHHANVDAILVQDIGMIDLIRKKFPNLDVHASTQLHIHNLDGVLTCEKLGMKRAVIARETDIETIKYIKDNSDIELEVFVHGALCMSYSGQCLMSSLIGGRSGNRGACAQCCRLEYDLISDNKKVNKDKYLLSTKDLCTVENIGELIESGVSSLKIEGRMKRSEYVYLVVSIYRRAIDTYYKYGRVIIDDSDILELKKIFNREFTFGYLFNEKYIVNQKRPNHQGIEIGKVIDYRNHKAYIKLNDSVNKGDGIRILSKNDIGFTLVNFYKDNRPVISGNKNETIEINIDDIVYKDDIVVKTTDILQLESVNKKSSLTRRIKINGKIILRVNEPVILEIDDSVNKVNVKYSKVDKAINRPLENSAIIDKIGKLGNTIYELENLDIVKDEKAFVSLTDLNEIRRKAISLLDSKRLYISDYKELEYEIKVPDFAKTNNINIKIINEEQYNKYKGNVNCMYTNDYELYKKLPDIIYITDRVINTYQKDIDGVMLGEFGGIYNYKNFSCDVFFNVTNSYTVAFLHSIGAQKVTLSYEMNYEQVKHLVECYKNRYHKNPNLEVIVYGREETMITKFNLLEYYNIKTGKLKDRYNNYYPIAIKNDKMVIYNYKRRDFKEDYLDIVNNIRYDLTIN